VIRQLAFDIPPLSALRRADFFASPANAEALAVMEDWQRWPNGRMMLVGPEGTGKTHLAHIWADQTGADLIDATDLVRADLPALAATRAVVIEDAHRIGGTRAMETALFHLYNLIRGKARLLITATTPPRDWGMILPDLQSRMQAMGIAHLNPPDDALLSAVLVKLFADRQIKVAPNLITYLLQHMDRSIAVARDVVAALDARALAEHRPVTRTMAADLLDRAGPQ
jgi:chromosomal replication initiation ATPase DnaA